MKQPDLIPPARMPFLEAICWQITDIKRLTLDEMLDQYERNWRYRGVLAELEGEELEFVRDLARKKGSWISTDV